MKLLVKIFVVLMVLSMLPYGVDAAVVIGDSKFADVSVTIPSSATLTLAVKNIAGDAVAPLSFVASGVTTAIPWRVSDQYLDIEYSCNTASWGVRIITDNTNSNPLVNPLAGTPGFLGVIGDKIGSGEPTGTTPDWSDGDEILSYAGLINVGEVVKPLTGAGAQNPKMRAALGWQVYPNKLSAKPANPADTNFAAGYDSDWAYVGDKANNVANSDGTRKNGGTPLHDILLGEETIVTGATTDGKLIFNYSLLAFGGVGQALAQHPVATPKVADDSDGNGKLDVVVYLAARFANTDYSNPASPVDFVLPGGTYKTKFYVELIYE